MNSVKTYLLTIALALTLANHYSTDAQNVSVVKQSTAAPEKPAFEATKALELALKALDDPKWKIRESRYKVRMRPDEDGWYIVVTFLPETPGAEAYVSVKKDGSTDVVPGF